jgi:hypothetical protein
MIGRLPGSAVEHHPQLFDSQLFDSQCLIRSA